MVEMIKHFLQFVPRTWKIRREAETNEKAIIEARRQSVEPSVRHFSMLGLPQEAAWNLALQLTGVPNAESVLNRLSRDDWGKMPGALETSNSLLPAIHATRTASNETLRDLLTRIIKGELESPDRTPRSVVELANKIGKADLECFLKLRRVLWKECDSSWSNPRSVIYCMNDASSYPGLLNRNELDRLEDLGLIHFGPVPFESSFPGPLAAKRLVFGDKQIMVTNTRPDAKLYLGHFALRSDGRYIIDLYNEPCELLYDHFESVCTEWTGQGFEITQVIQIGENSP